MEIALSLSGGGYRAAMFHLGTLHYLHHLRLADDGTTVLSHVNTLSTISGGTITGLWYMMYYCRQDDIDACFRELYTILTTSDIPTEALTAVFDKRAKDTSLIREMVAIYDKLFFHNETFNLILQKIDDGHIHHFCAGGTDFSNGYPFRFQATRKIQNAEPQYSRGFIGNKAHNIAWDLAGQIKLSEILAVSSCFPGGFEPMRFPSDFALYGTEGNRNALKDMKFDLMDGGIVDNQGIEPLMLANTHLTYDTPDAKGDTKYPCLDLLIISDVASPVLDKEKPFEIELKKSLSLSRIGWILTVLLIAFLVETIVGLHYGKNWLISSGLTGAVIIGVARVYMWNKLRKLMHYLDGKVSGVDWKKVKRVRLNNLGKLAETRLNSMLRLSQAIFMKPIRQMRYSAVYENERWTNRRITNNVNELSSRGSYRWKKNYPDYLKPSDVMKANSDMASSFATTLWFTKDDKEKGVPEALFAAGQYNICMNLLEYIENLRKNSQNTNENHQRIMTLEQQLRSDWLQFLQNPKFLTL